MKIIYLMSLLAFILTSTSSAQAETSKLWGEDGELWDPDTSLLRDFTNVGYKGGTEPIPDNWPLWKNITEFGAIADDKLSDLDALKEAIRQCPPEHAIGIPAGVFIIDDLLEIVDEAGDPKNNIVIRGENRDLSVLFFPKHLRELYPDDSPEFYTEFYTPSYNRSFITFSGGNNRGIENLSLVFRDEQKAAGYVRPDRRKQQGRHWYYSGENPIRFTGGEKDSWMQDIYIKNANHAIYVDSAGAAENITIMNVVIDQFVGRVMPEELVVGHMGIKVGSNAKNCLIHNIRLTGVWTHDICPMKSKDSVFSQISGPDVELDHHAQGNSYNLFTDVDTGRGGRGYGENSNNHRETYWGIKGINETNFLNADGENVMVGIHTSLPEDIGPNHHHEPIDPQTLTPINLYLAQLDYKNASLPADEKLVVPETKDLKLPVTGQPIRMLAIEDAVVKAENPNENFRWDKNLNWSHGSQESFLKFDLSDFFPNALGLVEPYRVELRIFVSSLSEGHSGLLQVEGVEPNSWSELGVTWTNRPQSGDSIDTQAIEEKNQWYEVDVTSYVNDRLENGSKVVSFKLSDLTEVANKVISTLSKESHSSAQLVIHWDESTVAPPATPTGLESTPEINKVSLDWNDNSEADLAGYNLYRRVGDDEYVIEAMNLIDSEYIDHWAIYGVTYDYLLKAVDTAGKESLEGIYISVTPEDVLIPNSPVGLNAITDDGQIMLGWDGKTEFQIDIESYEIYRSTQSGDYGDSPLIQGVTDTFYKDDSVANGETYYYKLVAVDRQGNRSPMSEEVSLLPFPEIMMAVAEYNFDKWRSLNSTDLDLSTNASTINKGTGLNTFSPQRITPIYDNPGYRWELGDIADATILDDDYLSFTITPEPNVSVIPHQLTFDFFSDDDVETQVYLYSSQVGFGTENDISLIDSYKMNGSGAFKVTLSLLDDSHMSEETEFRLYFKTSATSNSGFVWIDDIQLTELNRIGDADGDDLEDSWEYTYYGDITTSDGSGDYDGDGYTDLGEYTSGSDPIDPNNFFKIVSVTFDQVTSDVTLKFNYQYIDPKRHYSILYTDDLTTSDWNELPSEEITYDYESMVITCRFNLPSTNVDLDNVFFMVESYYNE